MPMAWTPPPAPAASIACVPRRRRRASGTRRDRAAALLRRLRVLNFGGLAIDDPGRDRPRRGARPGSTPARSPSWMREDEVEAALRDDMRAARSPSPASRAQDYKLGGPPEERRYTCPSYELERSAPPPEDWPTASRVDLPGFRPVEAYEAAIANLAPELTRRADPGDADAVLAWAGMPLATVEVAAVADRPVADVREELSPLGALHAGRRRRVLVARLIGLTAPQLLTPSLCCRLDERHAGMAAGGRDPARCRGPQGRGPHRHDGGARGVRVPGRLAAPVWAALVVVEAALAAGIAAGSPTAAYAAGLVLARLPARPGRPRSRRGARARPAAASGAAGGSRAAPPRGPRCWRSRARRCPRSGARRQLPLVADRRGRRRASSCSRSGAASAPRGRARARRRGAAARPGQPARRLVRRCAASSGSRCSRARAARCAARSRRPRTRWTACRCERFDEDAEPEAWAAARVPGAPYAVALGPDGVVLAKGTVNDAAPARLGARGRARAGRPAAATPAGATPTASRRAFLGRATAATAAAAGAGMVGSVVRPGDAEAYHFCGHIYTTDGCPHPTGLPRIDRRGLPLRAADGRRVDDLGRLIDAPGRPVDEDGRPLTDLEGRPLPAAPRTAVCRAAGRRFALPLQTDGVWYRCCGGRVRKLVDCCSAHRAADQRRQVAEGLLLRQPEGVLRHVLPELGAVLTACLLAAALAAGVTGAWSPCGLSMVETLAPGGYARTLRTSPARLRDVRARRARRRRAHLRRAGPARRRARRGRTASRSAPPRSSRSPPRWREARGLRIAPQIRRQVPEAWRRTLPVPLAAAGYGVLLGLGFTTFVLTFAVWALAGASVALGDPALGLAIGPRLRRRPRAAGHRARARRGHAPRRRGHRRDVRAAGDPARPAPASTRSRWPPCAIALGDRARHETAGRAARATSRLFAGSAYDPTAAAGLVAWQRPATARCSCAAARRPRCRARTRRSAARGSPGARRTSSCSRAPRPCGRPARVAAPGASVLGV